MTRAAGRVQPDRPWSPIFTSLAVIGGWWLVAHSSGQGWVQALGDLVFGALLVGVVGPGLAVRRVRVAVGRPPADVTAGLPTVVALTANARVRVRPVLPEGPEQMAGPRARRDTGADELVLLPTRRGVHRELVVDVATAAPFGIQWWTRRLRIALPEPLHVAPRAGTAAPLGPPGGGEDRSDGRPSHRRTERSGDLRAPRPYRPGDAPNRVHWPASAHTGELMVRETEAPPAEPVEVTVTLPADPEMAERVAGDALATVVALLGRGSPTVLTTEEAHGPVRAPVGDRAAAGRRLAAAVAPASGPTAGPAAGADGGRAVGIAVQQPGPAARDRADPSGPGRNRASR